MYAQRCKTFKKHFKEIVKVKFKKMTQKQRDYGRMITLTLMVCIILLGMCSCTVYKTPQMQITSVLAVTAQGDTLKLPIDVIRPIYNYNTYPSNRYPIIPSYPFYYSPNRYQPIYGQRPSNNNNTTLSYITPSNSSFGGTGSVGNSGGNPSVITPPPNPAVSNPKKNN